MKEIKTYRKIAILIAVLVFLLELVWVYINNENLKTKAEHLNSSPKVQQNSPKKTAVNLKKSQSASLPNQATMSLESIDQDLVVKVNTSGLVDAVDIVLNYDPKAVVFGDILSANNAYKLVLADDDKTKGVIKAALIKSGKSMEGKDLSLLKLSYKTLKPGSKVKLFFKKGASNDSNVFVNDEAVDVLSVVNSVTLK